MWAWLALTTGDVRQIRRAPSVWVMGVVVQCADINASLVALFWSTFLAILYHLVGLPLEGLLAAMVATAF